MDRSTFRSKQAANNSPMLLVVVGMVSCPHLLASRSERKTKKKTNTRIEKKKSINMLTLFYAHNSHHRLRQLQPLPLPNSQHLQRWRSQWPGLLARSILHWLRKRLINHAMNHLPPTKVCPWRFSEMTDHLRSSLFSSSSSSSSFSNKSDHENIYTGDGSVFSNR